jgi:hypothetical protein
MQRQWARLLAAVLFSAPVPAFAGELIGPGRFCGYAPVIDLAEGERIVTLSGGIHGGAFEWHGEFGVMTVRGIGWASKPSGRMLAQPTSKGHAVFRERRDDGRFVVAIWNHENGAAYFSSARKFTEAQLTAIDRVDLFDETKPEPSGCKLRTVFVWE